MQKAIFLAIAVAIATMALAPMANMSLAQTGGGAASAVGGAGGNGGSSAISAQGGAGGSATAVGSGSGGGLASGGSASGGASAVGGAGGNGGTCTDNGANGCKAEGGAGGNAVAGASGSVGLGLGVGIGTSIAGSGTGTGSTSGSTSVTTGTGTTTTTTTTAGGHEHHFFNHFGGHFFGLRGHFNFNSGLFFRPFYVQSLLTQYEQNEGISSSSSQVVILSETPGQILLTSDGQGTLVNPCTDSAPIFLSNGECAAQQVAQQTIVVQPQVQEQQQAVIVQQQPVYTSQCLSADQVQALVGQINTLQAQLSAQHFQFNPEEQSVFQYFHGHFHPENH